MTRAMAMPTLGKSWSTMQVTNSETRLPMQEVYQVGETIAFGRLSLPFLGSRFRRHPVVEWTTDVPDEQVCCQVPSSCDDSDCVATASGATQFFRHCGDRTIAPKAKCTGYGADDCGAPGRRTHRRAGLFRARPAHEDGLSFGHARRRRPEPHRLGTGRPTGHYPHP